jgi:hypothetical protein
MVFVTTIECWSRGERRLVGEVLAQGQYVQLRHIPVILREPWRLKDLP